MKARVLLVIICGLVPLAAGCDKATPLAISKPPLAIRIGNGASRAFDRVVVVFPEQREDYGRVPAGSLSRYRAVAKAYRYAYVEIKLGAEEAILQPIDYVGEPLLEPGRYTYRITLDPNATSPYGRAQLELVIDP